ncbi:hypothetical protein, partial [Tanticharoenia sakaeratensis]
QIWPVLLPFLTQHYPWIVPVIAVLFPIAAVFRGLSLLLGSYRSVQQTEHARDEDRYRAIVEQRDAAMRDLASERAAHEATRRRADAAESVLLQRQARNTHDRP